MRAKRWSIMTAALAAFTLLATAVPWGIGAASAAGSPPGWEPDVNAAPPYGNIVFYDANGNQVTSGTSLSSPFAYAVATTAADAGTTKAQLSFFNPGSNGSSLPA